MGKWFPNIVPVTQRQSIFPQDHICCKMQITQQPAFFLNIWPNGEIYHGFRKLLGPLCTLYICVYCSDFSFTAGSVARCSARAASPATSRSPDTTRAGPSPSVSHATAKSDTRRQWSSPPVDVETTRHQQPCHLDLFIVSHTATSRPPQNPTGFSVPHLCTVFIEANARCQQTIDTLLRQLQYV